MKKIHEFRTRPTKTREIIFWLVRLSTSKEIEKIQKAITETLMFCFVTCNVSVVHSKFDCYKSLTSQQHQMKTRTIRHVAKRTIMKNANYVVKVGHIKQLECFPQDKRRLRCKTG